MTLHVIDRVAVEDEGEGPVIVCIHGLGGSSNTFTPLMAAMARHRVVRIDLPGSARSQRVEGDLSIDRFVEVILNICSRLNITQAHWVGHSLGTIVCQHIAVSEPKMVLGLSLFGPLLSPPDAARSALQARAAKARSEGLQGMHDIAQALVQAALSSETRERLPLAVSFVRESVMRQDAESYARTCEALACSQAAAIEQVKVPVLLVTGDEDGVAPPQAVRLMANKFHQTRNCRVVVLPRCGHWTPIERPDECSRELREFLVSIR
jgi:3-oxoadipate enol-lactonase